MSEIQQGASVVLTFMQGELCLLAEDAVGNGVLIKSAAKC